MSFLVSSAAFAVDEYNTAIGISVARKFNGSPRFAAVDDGKLYVFLNEAIFNEFQKDRKGTIDKAERNWRKIRSTAVESL